MRNMMRDGSIDVCKGILIILLVIHHIVDTGYGMGIDNKVLKAILLVQRPLILCYFMQTFFLITGMCSNFSIGWKEFLIKQIRTLLVPGLFFAFAYHFYYHNWHGLPGFVLSFIKTGSTYWFLTAMFGGKIMYYFLRRLIHKNGVIIVGLLGLSFFGTFLNDWNAIPNRYWHRQMFDLTLYIAIGNIFAGLIKSRKVCCGAAIFYILTVAIAVIIWGRKIPYVTASFGTTMAGWPFHVVMSLTGSVVILWIARFFAKSTWLNYLGRNSLVVYMTHGGTLKFLLAAFATSLIGGGLRYSCVVVVAITIATCAIGAAIASIVNRQPLCFLMGKEWGSHFLGNFRRFNGR